MFTGLIEELGRVTRSTAAGGGREIEVAAPGIAGHLAAGDSLAVMGVCQTVTSLAAERFSFFAMGETVRATTLSRLEPGAPVNLERAMSASGRLDGHFVTGHVDGVGRIRSLNDEAGWRRIELELPGALAKQLVPKGSLAVDGISLTVGPETRADGCDLFIIPHTMERTTLGRARPGDEVNIETDILGKYVLAYLKRGEDGDETLWRLMREHGFMKGGDA